MKITAKLMPAVLLAAAMVVPAYAQTSYIPEHQSFMRGMEPSMKSSTLEGKRVIGKNGAMLGYVLAVNDRARLADVQTPGGIAITLPESKLRIFGGQVYALNMDRHDVLAMERSQTGRTLAMNIDLRHGHSRG
jgi:hypothetical protein